jgi:hypothetical protein
MSRMLSRRRAWLVLAVLAAGLVAACNGYASIGIGGPYVGVGPIGISTGVSMGFPL